MATLVVKALLPPTRTLDRTAARDQAVLQHTKDVVTSDRAVLARFEVADGGKRDDRAGAFEDWAKAYPAGTVLSVHVCGHDWPDPYNCKDDPRAQYREMTL